MIGDRVEVVVEGGGMEPRTEWSLGVEGISLKGVLFVTGSIKGVSEKKQSSSK